MNFKQLQHFSSSKVKALFGFHPKVLAEILFRVLPELEKRRQQRLVQRKDRKRAVIPHDGKPRSVLPLHRVLMTLLYLRHNVSHEVVGALYFARLRMKLFLPVQLNGCRSVTSVLVQTHLTPLPSPLKRRGERGEVQIARSPLPLAPVPSRDRGGGEGSRPAISDGGERPPSCRISS